MDKNLYGPFDVTWIGPCVWAGIIDELPPELVGKKVMLCVVGVNANKDYEPTVKRLPFISPSRHYQSKPPCEGFLSKLRSFLSVFK